MDGQRRVLAAGSPRSGRALGGVRNGQDAYEAIRQGASLVQFITALVYQGPSLARRINAELCALLARDGFANVAEAVGADCREPFDGARAAQAEAVRS